MFSSTYTNGFFDASNRDILLSCKIQGRRRAVGAKLSYYVFDVGEEQDAAVQLHGPEALLIIQALRSSKRCTTEKVKAAAGVDPPSSILTTAARDRILPS
jgi:hypothetical protein